jgi:RRXRR protein
LTTFHVGQQTHPAVLPQRRALESASADTPEGGHETGHRHRMGDRAVTGVEHGRGEIGPGGTHPDRRHPDLACAGKGANLTVDPVVFVLDAHGHPLDPCHPARARRLLARGRAVVAHRTPFVIRLKDRALADSIVRGVQVGIDPGSKHTGIALFTQTGNDRSGAYSLRLDHRGGQIRDKLSSRAALRRGRRSRNLRYRAPASTTAPGRRDGFRHRCDTGWTAPDTPRWCWSRSPAPA